MAEIFRNFRVLFWPFHFIRLQLRWRRCRKRGAGVEVYVSSYKDLSTQLKRFCVQHALLRGGSSGAGRNDFGILINYQHLGSLLMASSFTPGPVIVDVYFDIRPSVSHFDYFPPLLARKILDSSVQNSEGYSVPSCAMQFYSLVYHILYHKGLNTALTNPFADTVLISPHYKQLKELAEHPDIAYSGSFDVFALHEFMKKGGLSMPRDLLLRWPRQHRLLMLYHEWECKQLLVSSSTRDHILFLVRDDANSPEILAEIQRLLEQQLIVKSWRALSPAEKQRFIGKTRGGNWYERNRGRFHLVGPSHIFICSTFDPSCVPNFLANRLAGCKRHIRERINHLFPSPQGKRFVLHSADDLWDVLEWFSLLDTSLSP